MIFRESYGGAISFFNELKLDEAKRLIREGRLNFTEIADALGFTSLHYFSRLFKKKTGLSPSEYAKKE
jgi:AraC-like DNA-binding protein